MQNGGDPTLLVAPLPFRGQPRAGRGRVANSMPCVRGANLPKLGGSMVPSFPRHLVLAAMLCAFAAGCRERTVQPAAHAPLVQATGEHIGSGACRACHPAEHASWHGSFHRTMTQVASRDTVIAQFDRLELDWFGKPALLEWRGEQLWARFERGGQQPGPVDRPIEQLTGSHHFQVLWYSTGKERELAPFPMGFKLQERLWLPLTTVFVLPPELRDPPEPGAWNRSCLMCHSTGPEPRLDTDRTDTHVAELGISCEACHGPGRAHVAANQNPLQRYAHRLRGRDDSIVDPAACKPVHSAQLCGHCHSVSILRQQHFDDWREHGSPFRPGRDLHSTHLVVEPRDAEAPELQRELQQNPHLFSGSFWADGQVRLSGREFSGLRRSPCYTHGDVQRQMDCTSCHELHPDDGSASPEWRAGQMRESARGNAACTQCHAQYVEPAGLAAHTHHAPESRGSSCYDCHMPHTSIGLMKTSRSHEITSPSVTVELATGRPNACNLCHLDRTLQWTAEQLAAKWGQALPGLDEEQRTVASGARWLLTGDAGLRLLAACAAGGAAGQATAGTDWLAPFLARLLDDPYYVVRFAAARSLRSLPGGGNDALLKGYDFVAAADAVRKFGEAVEQRWLSDWRGGARPTVLVDERGLLRDAFLKLYARRDDRPVYLVE